MRPWPPEAVLTFNPSQRVQATFQSSPCLQAGLFLPLAQPADPLPQRLLLPPGQHQAHHLRHVGPAGQRPPDQHSHGTPHRAAEGAVRRQPPGGQLLPHDLPGSHPGARTPVELFEDVLRPSSLPSSLHSSDIATLGFCSHWIASNIELCDAQPWGLPAPCSSLPCLPKA